MTDNPHTSHQKPETGKSKSRSSRPVLFSALCGAALIYSVLMSMIFLAGIVKNKWLTGVLTDFFPERVFSTSGTFFFTITGLVLHVTLITGIVLLIRLRRIGFYIYGSATLFIVAILYFYDSGNLISPLIFVSALILISFFFKKLK
jgi:hypothetical protein